MHFSRVSWKCVLRACAGYEKTGGKGGGVQYASAGPSLGVGGDTCKAILWAQSSCTSWHQGSKVLATMQQDRGLQSLKG